MRRFLNAVPPTHTPPELHQQAPEFQVDEIFNVPEAGTVLGGVLTRGMVHEGDSVIVGPRQDGTFTRTAIATLRRNRTPCRVARAGEAVTVTLTSVDRADVRKVGGAWPIPLSDYIERGHFLIKDSLCTKDKTTSGFQPYKFYRCIKRPS